MSQLVVPTLFDVTSFARQYHVTRDVKPQPEAVHALKVLYSDTVGFKGLEQ